MNRHDRDTGSATLELVLVAPVLLLVLAAVIAAGRLQVAHQQVSAAAAQAARAAAVAGSAGQAITAAQQTAPAALSADGPSCQQSTITVDTARYHAAGSVTVRVRCLADLGGLVPGLSGHHWITGTASEVIDTYRQVTP
jgi:Flp pilus assembly protein TadG